MGICCSVLGSTECCGAVIKSEFLMMTGKYETELARANGLQADKEKLLGEVAGLERTKGALTSKLGSTEDALTKKTANLAASNLGLVTLETQRILQSSKLAWTKLSKKVKTDLLETERIQSEMKSKTIEERNVMIDELKETNKSLQESFEAFIAESNMQLEQALMLQYKLIGEVEEELHKNSDVWQIMQGQVMERSSYTDARMAQIKEQKNKFGEFIASAFGAAINEDGTITVSRVTADGSTVGLRAEDVVVSQKGPKEEALKEEASAEEALKEEASAEAADEATPLAAGSAEAPALTKAATEAPERAAPAVEMPHSSTMA